MKIKSGALDIFSQREGPSLQFFSERPANVSAQLELHATQPVLPLLVFFH